ncbi:hypothetical protein C5Y96_07595 [Blastopirellula marina]|uniref:Uncharacterized protein n=1 Tax=Blastopirellula marina TaxID=124 RepID=A0A2S8FYS1_9BACT|nr:MULTISPECIES: hypothetical protein [Pirellulaceae]PQO37014.1 hypothetical protein C5Y96_07595 [Blastopirellula marina]RCS53729.1 hypothetical protein DTL36_07605 [Bremerella cremea]
MMRLAVALVCFVTLFTSSAYAEKAERDLSGRYQCVGTSDQGGKYTGEVVIKKVNQGYKIDWIVGKTKYSGIGFVDEDRFSVAWTVQTPNGVAIGVVSYKIKENGTLQGKWTDPSLRGIYDETLVPVFENQLI